MGRIEADEIFVVTAQFDDEPRRQVTPRTIECNSFDEAIAAVKRGLAFDCRMLVERDLRTTGPIENDPAFDDWPAARHISEALD